MKLLYTDIDYVLSLATETKNYMNKWGCMNKFNAKAVNVYNKILKETGAFPVISSDWRHHYSLQQLQEIFTEWAHINVKPIDVTGNIPGSFQELEMNRAKEILAHVNEHNLESWVAIDDLDLSPWLPEEHFVCLPRLNEGIKQTGKEKEIIEKLNKEWIKKQK
jgi:hypothetical protein